MSAQGFRVLRRLEGWGFGGRKAVSTQGLRVLRRLEGPGFLRPQGSECARLQGSSGVGRLGFRRPQGGECARLKGFFGGWKAGGFLRLQGNESGAECGASAELLRTIGQPNRLFPGVLAFSLRIRHWNKAPTNMSTGTAGCVCAQLLFRRM